MVENFIFNSPYLDTLGSSLLLLELLLADHSAHMGLDVDGGQLLSVVGPILLQPSPR